MFQISNHDCHCNKQEIACRNHVNCQLHVRLTDLRLRQQQHPFRLELFRWQWAVNFFLHYTLKHHIFFYDVIITQQFLSAFSNKFAFSCLKMQQWMKCPKTAHNKIHRQDHILPLVVHLFCFPEGISFQL